MASEERAAPPGRIGLEAVAGHVAKLPKVMISSTIFGPFLALILAVAVFAFTTQTFFTFENLSLMAQQSVVIGTLALGQTLIILVAGIDLAAGTIMVLGTVIVGKYAAQGQTDIGIVLGVCGCVVFSSLNGLLITRFRIPPFITTLGMFTVLSAAARLYTASTSYPISANSLMVLGNGVTASSSAVTWGTLLWLGLTAVLAYVLDQTAWGVRVYAIGNSPAAARLNGINVRAVILSVYALAGVCYAFGAWQALGRTPLADPSAYGTANLDTITAVVLGGTSLFGGRGGVAGTFIGALIVVVLKNGLTQAGIDSLYQEVATGILVILAVAVDQYLGRGSRS